MSSVLETLEISIAYPIKSVQWANSHFSEVKSRLQRCANHQFIKECKVEQKAHGEDKE